MNRKLFIVGHPSLYGGAGTELHHQIIAWSKMGINLHIIPTFSPVNEPLFDEMTRLGVKYEEVRDYSNVTDRDVVINFCSKEFLMDLEKINKRTKRTAFVNCMTWLFDKEKQAHKKGLIALSLYQREGVMLDHMKKLLGIGSNGAFMSFKPYFNSDSLKFRPEKGNKKFTIGRISRRDKDKFSRETFTIWDLAVSPRLKRGIVLGFDQISREKTGNPPDWVECYMDQTQLPVKHFYEQCDIVVQSTDTTENLPRIGFEAMYSGCPLVVNNRGGWKHMIDHGSSGFLCNTMQEFVYWTSRLAFEPDLLLNTANKARKKAESMSSLEKSIESWGKVFNAAFKD